MTIPIGLLVAHFVGDFLLQSDWMALNKSKRFGALGLHVFVYGLCFSMWGLNFVLITMFLHFLTDAVTSRITSKLWFFGQNFEDCNEWHYIEGRRHWFFVAIGADQLIHYITLGVTYYALR